VHSNTCATTGAISGRGRWLGASGAGLPRLGRVDTISFARGIPGPDLLPVAEFGACAQRALERDGAAALNYGPPGGYPPLRAWIAERHGVDPVRVIVTNGSLQGFAFVARHFVEGGSRFWVEAPCYDRSLQILRRLGATVEKVELADDGLDVDVLAEGLRAGDVVYTIPTFQNPSGRTLSNQNRRRLVELAQERGATLFEDDPYGLLRFKGDPLPQLLELAAGEGVVFLSSFSKTVAPGIRTGYAIVPEELVEPVEAQVLTSYVSPAIFVEAALHEFVAEGRFEPNVARITDGLRMRRDAMLAALEYELAGEARWNEPNGGYFLWLDLPPGVDAARLLARATDAGVTFVKGSDFYLGAGGEEAARLAFSYATADEIDEGIRRLAKLVRDATAVAA
jgi:2-aminoadipate transaminase